MGTIPSHWTQSMEFGATFLQRAGLPVNAEYLPPQSATPIAFRDTLEPQRTLRILESGVGNC